MHPMRATFKLLFLNFKLLLLLSLSAASQMRDLWTYREEKWLHIFIFAFLTSSWTTPVGLVRGTHIEKPGWTLSVPRVLLQNHSPTRSPSDSYARWSLSSPNLEYRFSDARGKVLSTRDIMRTNLHCPKQQQQNDFNGIHCLGFSSPCVLRAEWSREEAAEAQELNHIHCHQAAKLVLVSLAFYRVRIWRNSTGVFLECYGEARVDQLLSWSL